MVGRKRCVRRGQIDIMRRACEEGLWRRGLGLGNKVGDGLRLQKAGDRYHTGRIKTLAAGGDECRIGKRTGLRVDNPVKHLQTSSQTPLNTLSRSHPCADRNRLSKGRFPSRC